MESILLVPVNTIKNKSYVNSNVEDNVISTTIIRYQETVLMPILGRKFYNYLIDAFNSNSLNSSDVELITNYISRCIIAGVDYRILVHLKTEVRANGLMQSNGQASKPDTTQLLDMNLKDANFYEEELRNYICENSDSFPDHKNNFGCCKSKNKSTSINNFIIV